MKIDRWIRLGVFSLALAGGTAVGAEFQQWRPAPQNMPAGAMPMPMAQAMPRGMNDPRFRPVPPGHFMMPPRPPAPYPGPPFVSVQGQYAPQPAFIRQYAWRPADQPTRSYRPQRVADNYPVPAAAYPMPRVPMAPPAPMSPYGPFAGGMYPSAPVSMLPPPPMPYPPVPGMVPGPYPATPFATVPGVGFNPFVLPPYPVWGGQPYAGGMPMGYPPLPLPPPWGMAWSAPSQPGWYGSRPGYGQRDRYFDRGPLGAGFPIAGLY